MPVITMRGTVVNVPKWTVEVSGGSAEKPVEKTGDKTKKTANKKLIKTARCMFQMQDGFRATCFVSHLALLELLLQEKVSAGSGLIISGKQYCHFHFI